MAIEIVDFPMKNKVDLSIVMLNYQRVLLVADELAFWIFFEGVPPNFIFHQPGFSLLQYVALTNFRIWAVLNHRLKIFLPPSRLSLQNAWSQLLVQWIFPRGSMVLEYLPTLTPKVI